MILTVTCYTSAPYGHRRYAVSPQQAADIKLSWQSELRKTDAECARNPTAGGIRKLLLHTERKFHQRGWDSLRMAKIFTLERSTSTSRVSLEWADTLSSGLQDLRGNFGGALGPAMLDVATMYEGYRIEADLLSRRLPGQDLMQPQSADREFYGFGLIGEAWSSGHEATRADRKSAQAHAHERLLDVYEHRVEGRMVQFAGRDGLCWKLQRRNGASPLVFCWRANDPDAVQFGQLIHALSRMTNAFTWDDVPIAPRAPQAGEPEKAP